MVLRAPRHEDEIDPSRGRGQEAHAAKERRKPRPGAEVEAKEQRQPQACAEPEGQPFRFDDPYWDEAFDSYYDPTLRTCCRF